MLRSLAMHGPDRQNQSEVIPGELALGHSLLQITPEDTSEEQPIIRAGELALVADARIDNRDQLTRELGLRPLDTQHLPDSALILSAWRRWGSSCLDHLCGAFGLAIWDAKNHTLVLARDHSGERPLYYSESGGRLIFATTARAIRSCPDVSSRLNERQLARDLVGLPPEYPQSRFRDICELAPGHCLVVGEHSSTYRRYWDIHNLPGIRLGSDEEYAERFREIFDEAVRCRLRTTGSVASELSAGLDSGAVAATAAHLLANQNRDLTAYTAVPCPEFKGPVPPGYLADEGAAAAEVVRQYRNMRQIRIDSTGSDMLRELERTYPVLDLPHAAALNAVWSNLIYDHARAAGIKVVLSGALGNFAVSYTGSDILHTLFKSSRLLETARTAWSLRAMGISSGRNAASLTIFSLLPWPLRRIFDPLIRGTRTDWSAISAGSAQEHKTLDEFRRYLFLHPSHLPRLMETQFQLNQYGDYNAAANAGWGIDVRDPTADRRVFEYCASIPPEQFLAQGKDRSLIRRVMRGRLPESTLNRKERGTQAADWYESLSRIRPRLATEIERIGQSETAGRLLDLDRLRRAIAEWPGSAAEAWRRPAEYQSTIPRGVAVGYFIRRVESER